MKNLPALLTNGKISAAKPFFPQLPATSVGRVKVPALLVRSNSVQQQKNLAGNL